ncbi:MAG TPA: hypothetical protein VHE80_06885 [Acidimicrobiales bacterium]|nr:hypothetical protein [Acidimicrobiales bacterium]
MSGRTCAAPDCDEPVARKPGQRGRPPIYCSPGCRPSRKGSGNQIRVDVDHDDVDGAGRFWTVTLHRGRRSVVVGRELGRFSATMLAGDLQALLHPRTRQEGDAID